MAGSTQLDIPPRVSVLTVEQKTRCILFADFQKVLEWYAFFLLGATTITTMLIAAGAWKLRIFVDCYYTSAQFNNTFPWVDRTLC